MCMYTHRTNTVNLLPRLLQIIAEFWAHFALEIFSPGPLCSLGGPGYTLQQCHVACDCGSSLAFYYGAYLECQLLEHRKGRRISSLANQLFQCCYLCASYANHSYFMVSFFFLLNTSNCAAAIQGD